MTTPESGTVQLAVNGTLMSGLELNHNLLDAGARLVRDDATAACYRLWSINDRHPAMIRTTDGSGAAVELEVWEISPAGLVQVLVSEPPGLAIGTVLLADGTEVLGIIGEPRLVAGQREITDFADWRAYTNSTARKA
jgi:hypothetical protein